MKDDIHPKEMKLIKAHKNITAKRLVLDLYQFFRAQSFIVLLLGRQFRRSRQYVEIDITYKCDLACLNCNRSCGQLPSKVEMPIEQIEAFIRQSVVAKAQWKRIRILGGEPCLHHRFTDIIQLLREYQQRYNPDVRLVVCTNLFSRRTEKIIRNLPDDIAIKSTVKTSSVQLFRPLTLPL